ncbi:MAG: hypothetical protein K1060chlam5_00496 [Candidatus Anoxychlamydiales bacterium]|nr:hypothetical protein [Candidatus Anoxychlamydiales bacterium]
MASAIKVLRDTLQGFYALRKDDTVSNYRSKIQKKIDRLNTRNEKAVIDEIDIILKEIDSQISKILSDPMLTKELIDLLNDFFEISLELKEKYPLHFNSFFTYSLVVLKLSEVVCEVFLRNNPQSKEISNVFEETLTNLKLYALKQIQLAIDVRDYSILKEESELNPLNVLKHLKSLDLRGLSFRYSNFKISQRFFYWAKILEESDLENYCFFMDFALQELISKKAPLIDDEIKLLNVLHVSLIKNLDRGKDELLIKKIEGITKFYEQKQLTVFSIKSIMKMVKGISLSETKVYFFKKLIDYIEFEENKLELEFYIELKQNKLNDVILNKINGVIKSSKNLLNSLELLLQLSGFIIKHDKKTKENDGILQLFFLNISSFIDNIFKDPHRHYFKVLDESFCIASLYYFMNNIKNNEKAIQLIKPCIMQSLKILEPYLSQASSYQMLANIYLLLDEKVFSIKYLEKLPLTDQYFEFKKEENLQELSEVLELDFQDMTYAKFKSYFFGHIKDLLKGSYDEASLTQLLQKINYKVEELKEKYIFLQNKRYEFALLMAATHVYIKANTEDHYDNKIFFKFLKSIIGFNSRQLSEIKKQINEIEIVFLKLCDYKLDLTTRGPLEIKI